MSTYISSTIGFRSKGSLYYSLNNHYSLNNRVCNNSLCCSCSCCAFPCHGVPISPRCLYGSRQSTLIQLATSRRLILGRGHRYLQLPVNDVDSVCYGSRRSGSERERGNGRVGCMVWEKSESFDLGSGGTAEAMLSLLTEEVDERFFGVGKRNGRLGVRRVRAEEGRRNVGEYCREEEKCVECDCLKRKLNRNVKSINISARDEDKYVELDLMKRGSKGKFESYSAKSSEEERKWSGGRNGLSWGDSSGLRKWNRNVESINIRSREEDKYVESESLKRDSREKLQPVNPKLREEHMWSGGREGFSKSENSGLRKSNRNMESVSIRSKKDNKYVESDLLERDSRGKLKSFSAKSREEERKWSGGRVGLSRGENSGLRKEVSNCSSYYSALSADDIDESDVDVQIKHERFMDGSWNKNKESRREDGEYRENVRKQSKIYGGDVKEKHEQVTVRSNTERESSVVATGLDWHSRNETKKKFTDQAVRQLESRKQSFQNLSNVQEIHQSASETPPSKEQLGGREGHSMESIDETRKHFRETGLQVYEHAGSKRKSQKLTEISGIRDIEIEGPSSSFVQFRGRDENPTESAYLTKEASEKYNPTIHSSSGQTESSMKSEQLTRIMTRESDIQRTSTSQRLSEVTLTNRDDSSTLLAEANGKQVRSDQQVIVRSQSKKEPQDTNIPMSRVSNTTVIDAQKHFESRKSIREKRSNSTMDLVEEALEEKRLATGRVLLKGRTSEESQRPNRLSSFRESSSVTSSSSQAPFSLVQQAAMQQLNEGNESRGSEVIMTPPRPQLVKRTVRESVHYQEPTSRLATEEVSRETSSYESTNLSIEEVTDDFYLEADHNTRKYKLDREHSELMFQDDALGSANRLEESSTQFVGDFAEKLRHEGSVLLEETTSSQTTLGFKGEGYTHQDSRQQVSNDFQSQVHGSNRSSFGTGRRAPPDEMWDVAGPSSLEPPRTEATGVVTPSTGSAVVKSSRSLWGIIADIVRLRWGMQSETHKSTVKLGVKSSSNESMGSEVWFSGHKTDDKDDENFNMGKRVVPKVDVSSDRRYLEKSSNEREQEASGVASGYKVLQTEADKPSSSGAVESSSQRREENFGRKDLRRGQSVPSSISTVNSSLPLTSRQFIRSPPLIEQIPETSKPETSGSGLEEIVEPVREHPSVASEMDVKDGELKQRKLQRNKQVLQERFGEWEEAYRLESEQRIIDEMFMREALLEAKRAADTWEVPVGAVLVKQGKIIARGCNLVEELRDSTAHAEMICIREASNVLRTWRLADTTLYVTLEPCAMCAGAILQARVDTVVWGAPNKLLGADGSWVRLFPSGGEGGGHDLSNQALGPVHPFHPKMTIRRGILSAECADAMQQFFQLRRKKEKKPSSPPASCLPISTHPSKFISKMHDIFSIMFCG